MRRRHVPGRRGCRATTVRYGSAPAPAGIQHRQWCVIGEQPVGGQYADGQPLVPRFKPPAGGPYLAGQGGAADFQAMAGQDPALPVKRQVVSAAADQHVREQRRRGETAGDHPPGGRRLVQGAAGAFGSGDAQHP